MQIKYINLFAAIFLIACTEEKEKIPTRDPSQDYNNDLRGPAYGKDVLISQGEDGKSFIFHWAQQAFAGYKASTQKDMPAEIAWLPDAVCEFTKPETREYVHHVHVVKGRQFSSIYAIEDSDIQKRAKRMVAQLSNPNIAKARKNSTTGDDNATLVNVLITKTDHPVYLVLSSQGKTLWNIHAADQVTLSNIAVIGNDTIGIVNPPENVPIEALYGTKRKGCKVEAARMPQDDWRFVQNVKNNNSGSDLLVKNKKRAKNYSRWFQSQFDVSSYRGALVARGFGNVLIGPMPATLEQRIAFKPFADSKILLSSQDHIFASSNNDYKEKAFALVESAAKEAAGGDLSLITASRKH